MITKTDAIAIGKAITAALVRSGGDSTTPEGKSTPDTVRHAMRGSAIYALDNLWYDVLPMRTRDAFGRKEAFYDACDWPN